ncbi:MAG: antitoxin MazE family protein [Rhodospirillales bacterium]
MAKQTRKAARDARARYRVRAYRKRMRAKGMRLVQMWLPDTSTPEFKRKAHLDSLAIANSPQEAEDQAFVDSISIWPEK